MVPDPLRTRHLNIRNRHLFGSDLFLFAASIVIAFALRFEGFEWGPVWTHIALIYLAVSLPVKLYCFWTIGIYRRLWRYSGVVDVERLISASIISGLACIALGLVILPTLGWVESRVPLSVLFIDALPDCGLRRAPPDQCSSARAPGPAPPTL